MKDNRIAKGRRGEDLAAWALKEQGFQLWERNYRNTWGEIDIIAFKENCLYFVEVRSKSSQNFGTPAESINSRKKRKLQEVAEGYLAEKGREYTCGFLFAAVNLRDEAVVFIEDALI